MADNYIDKIKYDNNRYFLLDSGATHDNNHKLSGTTSNFKSNGTIVAEQGLFNKLIATNASISSLDVNNLTAQNATVVGLLDVQGQLKTNSWTNSNIATIEGNFYIAPTLGTSSSLTTGTTKLTISKTNNIWEITIAGSFLVNQIGADPVSTSDTDVNQWSTGSKVLITGEIAKDDGIYPLGTLKGVIKNTPTMNSSGIATSINITNITDNLGNTEILDILGIGSYYYRNIKISLTQRKYGSSNIESENMRPIGILMSAQGRSSKSFIDIYGGANKLEEGAISGADSDYGGLAIPNVRIGNLRGLPSVGNQTPTGWGIYTDNGYFKGTIVANTGEIGRFTIANDLYSGQLGGDDSVCISIGTQQTAQIGGVATPINNWAFTAGNKFGVTADGDLYASNATISGTLTITNKNSNILTKEEAEALANTTQNMTQESIEDILKVVDMTSWIAKYGDCEPTSDTEAIKGKLYFDVNKQQVIPMVNPHLQNYYELNNSTWTETEDTIVDINKQYFERNGESNYYYTPIKPVGNENPSEEQWYELSNDTYQLSSDNDLVNNKLYFLQITDGIDTYYQVITEYIPNPYALGLYELNSINKSISSYINTHVRLDNGAIIIQADNTEASISISLNDGILLKDDNGIPIASFSDAIVLGNRSEMHLELSPGDSSNNILPELGFYDGYTKVAYVNSDTLNINRGEIKEKLRIGQFEWRTQGANRISLIYTPISS